MMRVLLVQNDQISTRRAEAALQFARMTIEQARDGEDAFELARAFDYAVIIADLDLRGMSSIELIARLRNARVTTPVVLLTGEARSQARVRALEVGADDVITTPFDPLELVARVRAVVRRTQGIQSSVLQCGPIALNSSSREVTASGIPVPLTNREFAILELLVIRRNAVVTKEAILNRLYGGGDAPDVRIIDVFMCKLRRKLEEAGAPEMVRTIYGLGYAMRQTTPQATAETKLTGQAMAAVPTAAATTA